MDSEPRGSVWEGCLLHSVWSLRHPASSYLLSALISFRDFFFGGRTFAVITWAILEFVIFLPQASEMLELQIYAMMPSYHVGVLNKVTLSAAWQNEEWVMGCVNE